MTASPLLAVRATACVLATALLASCGGGGGSGDVPAAAAAGNQVITGVANRSPLIVSMPVNTAKVGASYSGQVTATDPDGDALTYSLTQAPTGMAIDATSGTIAWLPSPAHVGDQAVTVRVVDSRGLGIEQTFSIAVSAASAAPQIVTTPVTTAVVGVAYNYASKATDPNGQALTYSLAQAPGGMSIDGASGLLAWTPSATQVGSQAVTVRVTDTGGLAAEQAFVISVISGNAAPQIVTTPPATAVVGTAYSHAVNAIDPNGDALTYSLLQAPAGMTINAASGLISWIPAPAQTGSQSVTLRVVDPGALAATQTFSIVVSPANAPPQITSSPVTVAVAGAAYSYDVDATDPNGDVLSYSLAQAPTGMTINAATGLIGWIPSPGQTGSQAVTVRVADAGGLAATQAFSITVAPPNVAPQITSTPVIAALAGTAYGYNVKATDANGDTLTYSLTQAPAGMTINASSGLISWIPLLSQAGNQAVTVRVADPGGLTATQAFTIAVTAPNLAPQITSTPLTTAVVGAVYSHEVDALDPNGDVLAYSLTQAPSGMTINAASGLITWTPLSQHAGLQAVTVRVVDPGGLAATQSFSITVGGGTRIDMSTPATYSAVAGTTTAITLNWSRIPMAADYQQFMHLVNAAGQTWSVDDHGTTSTTWTTGAFTETRTITVPAALASGVYDIRVGLAGGNPWDNLLLAVGPAVTDPGGDRRYRVGSITVVGNQAPQITSSPVTTATINAAYSYAVSASDADGDTLTYSLTQAPGGMTINASNGLIAWTPTAAQAGSQPVSVRVADGRGLTATQSFSITVGSNAAPQITSTPVATATAGVAYSYDVNASDPNGDTLSYSLTQAPSGMTINASNGLIAWTPTSGQVGTYGVTVRVADPGGLAATQSFSIVVGGTPAPGPMTMSCADGAGMQCSGESVLRTDNGIALTRSGTFAYGRSTSDMAPVNPNISSAVGLALGSGGVAEIRVRKDSNAVPTSVAVLLSNIGILWDGQNNRPQIIETFNPTAGRVTLDGTGALAFATLPPSSNLSFYDYAYQGTAATKPNYANNRYFPRTDPPRCVPGGWCAPAETSGPQFDSGSWRFGGNDPDSLTALRYHEDGDVHAGNGIPLANGTPTWLPGGSGFGVPMPGSKGYRTLSHWSYRYGNLAYWFTQDTVNIAEWGAAPEHNKNRRGFVAFGEVTEPASVPTSGSSTYAGVVRGTFSFNGTVEPVEFVGNATVTVNFATRSVSVSIQNTVRADTGASVPVALTAATSVGTGSNANYLTGTAANASMSGGLGGRFFGPVVTGGNGTGPSEVGGTFSLSNAGSGAVVVAGFIARKQ